MNRNRTAAVDRIGLQNRLPRGIGDRLSGKPGSIQIDNRVRDRPIGFTEHAHAELAARARIGHRTGGGLPAHELRHRHVRVTQGRILFEDHMRRRVQAQGFATLLIHPRDDHFRLRDRRAIASQAANDLDAFHVGEPVEKRIRLQGRKARQCPKPDEVSLLAPHNRGRRLLRSGLRRTAAILRGGRLCVAGVNRRALSVSRFSGLRELGRAARIIFVLGHDTCLLPRLCVSPGTVTIHLVIKLADASMHGDARNEAASHRGRNERGCLARNELARVRTGRTLKRLLGSELKKLLGYGVMVLRELLKCSACCVHCCCSVGLICPGLLCCGHAPVACVTRAIGQPAHCTARVGSAELRRELLGKQLLNRLLCGVLPIRRRQRVLHGEDRTACSRSSPRRPVDAPLGIEPLRG